MARHEPVREVVDERLPVGLALGYLGEELVDDSGRVGLGVVLPSEAAREVVVRAVVADAARPKVDDAVPDTQERIIGITGVDLVDRDLVPGLEPRQDLTPLAVREVDAETAFEELVERVFAERLVVPFRLVVLPQRAGLDDLHERRLVLDRLRGDEPGLFVILRLVARVERPRLRPPRRHTALTAAVLAIAGVGRLLAAGLLGDDSTLAERRETRRLVVASLGLPVDAANLLPRLRLVELVTRAVVRPEVFEQLLFRDPGIGGDRGRVAEKFPVRRVDHLRLALSRAENSVVLERLVVRDVPLCRVRAVVRDRLTQRVANGVVRGRVALVNVIATVVRVRGCAGRVVVGRPELPAQVVDKVLAVDDVVTHPGDVAAGHGRQSPR